MLYVLLIAAVWVLYSYGLAAYSWRRPTLGVIDGQLQPCGAKPNCVCSCHAGDAAIESLPIASEEPRTAFDRARKCVESLPRTALVEAAPGYARYECSSALFRYTDDVELLLDESAGEIHIRSASRVGHSDFGVNRQRVAAIRERFQQ